MKVMTTEKKESKMGIMRQGSRESRIQMPRERNKNDRQNTKLIVRLQLQDSKALNMEGVIKEDNMK